VNEISKKAFEIAVHLSTLVSHIIASAMDMKEGFQK
jgi:hypothetical protein